MPRLRAVARYLAEPFGYRNPVWSPPTFYDRVAAHVPAHQRVPVIWRLLPLAWRPVRVYLRAGDHALFVLWWWTAPVVWKVTDVLGVDPVVNGWKREDQAQSAGASVASDLELLAMLPTVTYTVRPRSDGAREPDRVP